MPLRVLWMRSVNFQAGRMKTATMMVQNPTLTMAR